MCFAAQGNQEALKDLLTKMWQDTDADTKKEYEKMEADDRAR